MSRQHIAPVLAQAHAAAEAETDRILQMIALNLPEAILVTEVPAATAQGRGSRIIYANAGFEGISGYVAAEVVGRTPALLWGADTDPAALARIEAAVAAGLPVRDTLLGYRKDGTVFWLEIEVTPVAGAGTAPRHCIAVLRDIGERVGADALAFKIGEHVPGILYQYRLYPDGRHSLPFVTRRIRDICGLTPEEVRDDASAVFERIHPEDRAGMRASILHSAKTMTVWRHDYRTIGPDGRIFYMRGESSPERLADGSCLWHGYFADVSRDHEARQGLQLAKTVFDSSFLAIMVTDRDNNIVSVNPAFEQMTGYTVAEVVGRNPRILSSGKQSWDFYKAMWDEVLTTGSWRGEIVNRRKSGELYPEWMTISLIRDAGGAVKNCVAIFSDETEQKLAEAQIQNLAFYDPLTGLANRRLAEDRLDALLARARRDRSLVAVIFIDLDHFKVINDTCGHKAGDDVLAEVARRLGSVVRGDDVLARLGGDEFIVGLGGLDDVESAMRGAERLIREFQAPFEIAGRRFQVSASLGIAIYPNDAGDLASLKQFADQAMYAAKDGGRAGFRFFSRSMHHEMLERAEREELLRKAVAERAFDIYFQPQVDIATGAVVAAEALIRARDPALGGPDLFIPLAEELGLIHELGELTLRESCRQARLWRDAGMPARRIAVNISALQFTDPQLAAKIAAALAAEDLPADAIEIEITETAVMADADRTIAILDELNALGVEIAIDDFGTGYSSLAYLRHFPVDRIKIDRAFVAGIETDTADVELVRAVVSLARALDLDTLAEGVETDGQRALLHELGCGMGQGFLFGRPARAGDW